MQQLSYRRHRFPPLIIQHATWLYLRFTLSYRDVEELLAERGIDSLLVFTKADKLSRNKLKTQFDRLDSQKSLAGISFVSFSAADGRGKDDIWGWINDALAGKAV